MKFPLWMKQCVTEPDNSTVCPVRVIAIAGCAQFLGLTIAHYCQHHIFDAQNFAIGFAAILGGAGAALGMKKDTPVK